MPVKGVYSKVIEPTEYVAPMDLDLYLKGETMQYEQSQKKLQELQNQVSNVFNIPAYGIDKEKLNEYQQKFQADLQSLSGANLKDINTSSKLNNIIKQYANNSEILNIAQRGYKWQQYQKELSDIKEKGKIVPVWKLKDYKDAENYYNGTEFIADKKFTGNIQEGFDWNKFNKDVSDGVDKTSLQTTVGANQKYFEGKTYNHLATAYKQALQSQPGALEDLQQQFEHYYGDQDWAAKDKQLAVEQYQQAIYMAANGQTEDIRQQSAELAKYWQQQSLQTNNNMSKDQAFNNFILANVDDFASAHTTYALKDTKMGEQAKLTQTFNQQKALQNDRQAFEKSENALNRESAKEIAGIRASSSSPEEKQLRSFQGAAGRLGISLTVTENGIEREKTVAELIDDIGGNKNLKAEIIGYGIDEKISTSEAIAGIEAGDTEIIKKAMKYLGDKYNIDVADDIIIDGETIKYDELGFNFENKETTKQDIIDALLGVTSTTNTQEKTNATPQQNTNNTNKTIGVPESKGATSSAPKVKVDTTNSWLNKK